MADDDLLSAIRAILDWGEKNLPEQHPLRTLSCPRLLELAQYEAAPEGSPDKVAIRLHLERDPCQGCALKMRAPWVKDRLAKLVRAGQKALAELLADGTAVGHAWIPLPEFAEPREPFAVCASSPDQTLVATLLEDRETAQFAVLVQSPKPEKAGKIAQVELISKERELPVEVRLEHKREHGSSGIYKLGGTSEYSDLFDGCAVIAHWKDETP